MPVEEVVKAKAIALKAVLRAMDAFLADPKVGGFDLGGGFVLTLTATIAGSVPPAKKAASKKVVASSKIAVPKRRTRKAG